MKKDPNLQLKAIGRVVQGPTRPKARNLDAEQAVIEIDAAWKEALDGIEEFSHIWVTVVAGSSSLRFGPGFATGPARRT